VRIEAEGQGIWIQGRRGRRAIFYGLPSLPFF